VIRVPPRSARGGHPSRSEGVPGGRWRSAVGFVVGAFLLSKYASAAVRHRLLGLLAITSLALLAMFALKPNLALALVLLGLAGAVGAYIITVTATFATWVPNELRGGAQGLYRTGLRVAQGVGVALGGAMAQAIGSAVDTITFAGLLGVVLAIPTAVSWTRVRRSAAMEIGL